MNDHLTSNIARNVKLAFRLKPTKQPGNKIHWDVRKMMTDKDKCPRKLMRTKDPGVVYDMMEKIEEIEKELRKRYDKIRKDKETKVVEQIKDEPAIFYSYAKSFTVKTSDIGALEDEKGNLTNYMEEMTNILSGQYKKMWTTPRTEISYEEVTRLFGVEQATRSSGTGVRRGAPQKSSSCS